METRGKGGGLWDGIRVEVGNAWRAVAARPLQGGLSALTLALGIGGTTAALLVAREALMRPLPVRADEELVGFWNPLDWSAAEFASIRGGLPGVSGLAAWRPEEVTYRGGAGPAVVVQAVRGSAEFFDVLGVAPLLGRTFQPGDDRPGAEAVVVASHGFWVRSLGGSEDALGRRIVIDGAARTVVGIMPDGFHFPTPSMDLWLPLELEPDDRAGMLALFGRLDPGRERGAVAAAMTGVAGEVGVGRPDRWSAPALTPLRTAVRGDPGPIVGLVAAVMLLVLTVVCANVAALAVARMTARSAEMAIRGALGAGRGRLARQLVLESVGVALPGALGGAVVAVLALPFLTGRVAGLAAGADPASVGVTALVVGLAAGAAIGLAPVVRLLRGGIRPALSTRSGTGPRGGLASALVVLDVALAVALVAGAGVTVRSVHALAALDPGFDPVDRVAIDVVLGEGDFGPEDRVRTLAALEDRLRRRPDVRSVGVTQKLPLRGPGWTTGYRLEDSPDELRLSAFRLITPGYAEAMGLRLVEGRWPDASDRPDGEPVVVVGASLARELWPGRSAVGRRVTSGFGSTWATVIGVVDDVRVFGLRDEAIGTRYQLWGQAGIAPEGATLVVHRAGASPDGLEALEATIHDVEPRVAVAGMIRLETVVRTARGPVAALLPLFTALGGLALLLGAVGVYGVTAQFVGGRTREWGVRLALGQDPPRVVGHIVRRGMALVFLGVACGLVAAWLGAGVLESLVFSVGSRDPASFAVAAGLLAGAGLVASLVPAVQAGRTDPVTSLRAE